MRIWKLITMCLVMLLAVAAAGFSQQTTDEDTAAKNERIAQLESKIEAIQAELGILKNSINEPEGSIQTTVSDVKKIKQIKFSGYFQGRYTYDFDPAKANSNGFSDRRARLKAEAKPSDNITAVYQIDFGGSTVTTKDAYIQYAIKGDPAKGPSIMFGQFLTPFGYQLTRSSSLRETPEFSDVVAGLLGPTEYDQGVKFSTATDKPLTMEVGLFNGEGANKAEVFKSKNIIGRLRYAITPNFDAGISGYSGSEAIVLGKTEAKKTRIGADAEFYLDDASIKAEYISGRDKNVDKSGYWAQVTKNITKQDTGVVMYDVYDNGAAKNNVTHNWNVGWIRYLDQSTKVKLFWKFPDNHKYNLAIFEVLTTF